MQFIESITILAERPGLLICRRRQWCSIRYGPSMCSSSSLSRQVCHSPHSNSATCLELQTPLVVGTSSSTCPVDIPLYPGLLPPQLHGHRLTSLSQGRPSKIYDIQYPLEMLGVSWLMQVSTGGSSKTSQRLESLCARLLQNEAEFDCNEVCKESFGLIK